MKEKLLIIAGPTGVGKTSISLEVAEKLKGEVISADSMQIFKGLDIGTAKITEEEMSGITHHLIDIVEPSDSFSVADFAKRAKDFIEDINNRKKLPIVVGGTGLYINSLVYNLDFQETSSNLAFREKMKKIAATRGREFIYRQLMEKDPESAHKIEPNNINRVIRALEIYEFGDKKRRDNFREKNQSYNMTYICLNMDRAELYNRINKRVDVMVENGLFEEVKSFLNSGITKNSQSMKAIGYKEVLAYYEGCNSYEETIDLIKQHSRNYAKRQLTWFRRDDRVNWINIDEYKNRESIIEEIIGLYKNDSSEDR